MIQRSLRIALRVVSGLFAALAVLSVALVWRLQSGPVSLDFLTPYVEQALNANNARYNVVIGDTVLTWAGWDRTIDVRVIGAQATDKDGRSVVQVPEIAISFSLPAMLRGVMALQSIEVFRPELHLVRDTQGRFALGLGDDVPGQGNLFERIARIIASAPSPENPISYMERFNLVDAQLLLEDISEDWSMRIPVAYLEMKRDASGARGEATLNLPLGDTTADIFVQAVYRVEEGMTVAIQFDDVSPLALARAMTPLQALSAVDAAFSGTLRAELATDGIVDRMELEVSAGSGFVDLPNEDYGRIAFQRIAGQVELDSGGNWRGNAEFLVGESGRSGRLTLAVTGHGQEGARDVVLRLDGVKPSAFAGALPGVGMLASADIPLTGTMTAGITVDGTPIDIDFDLSAGAGSILPFVPSSQPIGVSSAILRGNVEGNFDHIDIEAFSIEFTENAVFPLPGADGHAMPIRSFSVSGSYDAVEDKLVMSEMEADLDGPLAKASGTANSLRSAADIMLSGSVKNVLFDEAERYWPKVWGKDAYAWVSKNMSEGVLSDAAANVHIRGDDKGGYKVASIDGDMNFANVTVSYLGNLPPATGVYGQATFDHKNFTITINSGAVGDLEAGSGTIKLTDINAKDSYGDFDLVVHGPFSNAMDLLDREPLGFASVLGLSPSKTGGWATTRLHLFMILENDLSLDEIEIEATAELRDVLIREAVLDLDINSGNLLLKVDKKGMDVYGRILLGTMPGLLDWRENFTDDAPFRSRYDINGSVTESQRTNELGLNFPPFNSSIIKGPANAAVRHTVYQDGRGKLDAQIDLSRTDVDLSTLQWRKEPGIPGTAGISLDIQNDKITAVPRFSVAAGDLSITGSVTFADEGDRLDQIRFDDIRFGRNDLSGLLIRRPEGGWDADFNGEAFDMSTLLGDALTDRPDESSGYDGPPLSLSANIQTVWLGPDRQLKQVAGALVSNGKLWSAISLEGRFSEGQEFQVHLAPDGQASRRLEIRSGDAGAALRGLGLYDNMIGGALEIDGTYDDSKAGSPLTGKIAVDDFRIVRAPVLVQLLSVMALTGVLDVLQGEGLAFNDLEAPFVLVDGMMTIEEGRAAGNSIGFTASGQIDTRGDAINLEGTVVPAYVINSALGNLPLVGSIFTGGEKGSGVFAATYSMRGPTEEPSISVNPLSALAPGFLRKLFGIFDSKPPLPESTAPSAGSTDPTATPPAP